MKLKLNELHIATYTATATLATNYAPVVAK
jgi:hypothetical protein